MIESHAAEAPSRTEGSPLGGRPCSDVSTRLLAAVAASRGEHGIGDISHRVATAVAEAEPADLRPFWSERFADRIQSFLLVPSFPILANAGCSGRLAACFVVKPEDSLDSIYETLGLAARIQQGSGGSGVDLSALRPHDTPIRSSGGVAPGPVAFVELYAHSARINARAGRRPGAHLGILRDDHPDILEFVRATSLHPKGLPGMGLAVGVGDALIEEAATGSKHRLRHPRGGRSGSVSADALLAEIACSIHQGGEPTLLFVDTIERANPAPETGRLEATNPCGEQPLLPGESCVLASLNLPAFADAQGAIDADLLAEVAGEAVRFLDDVVEINDYPTRGVQRVSRRTRKVGLGLMGFADLLLLREVPYGSGAAADAAFEVASIMADAAMRATMALADERGAYPAWAGSPPRRRNATVLAIAPTGILRLLGRCSAGIEPFIRPVATVRDEQGSFRWTDAWLEEWLERHAPVPARVLDDLEQSVPTDMLRLPRRRRVLLRRAWEVPPEDQIAIQASFQRWVDGAVSKTVHLPTDISVETIVGLITLAHRSGCKGVAFFRHGSRGPETSALPPEIDLTHPCSV